MRQRVFDAQDGFGGGLNTVADESQLAPNQFRLGANTRLTESNAAKKRLGSRRLHTAALAGGAPVRGGHNWGQAAGATLFAAAGGNLYYGTYSFGMVWGVHPGAIDPTAFPSFASFRDGGAEVVYVADGGALNKVNGTTFSANLASTPNTAQIAVFNGRLYGISGVDETISYSDLGNGDTLGIAASGGGQAVVRTFGDQRLTVLAPYRSSLFMFHVSGISKFTGWSQDDINISAGTQGVTGDVGTIAPRSVVILENGVLFLSDRGIYTANTDGVSPVSVTVDISFSSLTADVLSRVSTVHNRSRREVWFFIPEVGVFVYNYRTQAWVGPWTGGYIADATSTYCMFEATDADQRPIVLAGDFAGFVKHADQDGVGKDNVLADGTGGDLYTMSLKCHRLFSGAISTEKSYRWAYLLADLDASQDATFRWSARTGSGSEGLVSLSSWGTGSWGSGTWGGEGVLPFRIPLDSRGGFIDITIEDAGDRTPLFSRVEIEAFDMGRRG